MATFYLLPQGIPAGTTNNWLCSTGSDFVDLVDEDDDSTYIYETTQNHQITYGFHDPSVAEEGIDFDEDVTVSAFVHAHYTHSSGIVNMAIRTMGSGIMLAATTVAVDDSTYPPYSGVSGTDKAISTPWDYTGLQNLQMNLKCTGRPARFNYLRVSYIFFRVDYTEVAATITTDNATFFGANF